MRPIRRAIPLTLIGLVATNSHGGGLKSYTFIVHNISAQFHGQPDYEHLFTHAISVQFSSPDDYVLSTTTWNWDLTDVTLFNADPVRDDPLGLIDDQTGGHVPFPAGILSLPGYEKWAWDTNLSIDNSPMSIPEPVMIFTPTHIGPAGAFLIPPRPPAGADLRVQIAQITLCGSAGVLSGHCVVVWEDGSGGPTHFTVVHVPFPGQTTIPPDFNHDFVVNGLDLGILLSEWSIPIESPGCGGGDCCPFDLTHDSVVDADDLSVLLAAWGPAP